MTNVPPTAPRALAGRCRVPFVVVAKQRSGSTMLEVALDSHPQIRCHDELFHGRNTWSWSYRQFLDERDEKGGSRLRPVRRPLLAGRYLDLVFSSEPSAPAVGFRLMYNHLRQNPQLLFLLRRRRARVIHLVRTNVLKARVSTAAARQRQVYRSDVAATEVKVLLPLDGLLEELHHRDREIAANRRRLRGYHPLLEVAYEEVQASPDREFARILRFLDVDPEVPLRTGTSKQNPDRLEDVLANYDEVAGLLRGTPYEACLS